MSKTDPKAFIERLKRLGLKPRSYSGRGMYGSYCVAVSLGRYDTPEGMPRDYCQDSLGLDTIIYWPQVTWPDDVEEED